MIDEKPFVDIQIVDDEISIPELKWREMLFVGGLRPDGDAYVRDPARPMTAFVLSDPFPAGVRFYVRKEGGRVFLRTSPARRPTPGQ